MELKQIRDEIDAIDKVIVKAFEKRMQIVDDITKYKIDNNMQILDRNREMLIINKAKDTIKTDFVKDYIEAFYENIMELSRHRQNLLISSQNKSDIKPINYKTLNKNAKIGYLGEIGSFSYQATIEYFGEDMDICNKSSFDEIILGVTDGSLDCAILPIENTLTGDINQVIDLLIKNDVFIKGEHIIKIEHNLLGKKDSKIEDIDTVISHPQALEQCSDYIRANNLSKDLSASTATAALQIAQDDKKNIAAIASKYAGKIYDLELLISNIENNNDNFTRFIIIEKEQYASKDANKISITCTILHKVGALFSMLKVFADQQINIQKIVSRPIPNQPWKYSFYLDLDGNLEDENIKNTLNKIGNFCSYIRVLGNYKRGQ